MKSILTSKVNDEEIIVLDKLSFDNISTKVAKKVLEDVKAAKKALIVVDNKDDVVYKSFRNLAGVEVAEAKNINVYDVIKHDSLVVTQDAVKKIEEVFA